MDNMLLIIFGTLTVISLIFAGVATWFAFRNAQKKDGEVAMAFWAVGALAGYAFAGMATAYFLLPIALFHLSR